MSGGGSRRLTTLNRGATGLLLVFAVSAFSVPAETKQRELDLEHHFASLRGCFVMLEVESGDWSRFNPRQCAKRLSPCSTFKIPASLIGLDSGVVTGADHTIPWDGSSREREVLNRDHDLRSAIRHSVVWYYQAVAEQVGERRMREALREIEYGNQDISGGLTRFWLGSSLTISADEQVAFLARLQRGELPVSRRSTAIVREILILGEQDGAVLRGKTGTQGAGGDTVLGWFVGWVTSTDGTHVFATNIEGDGGARGTRARKITEAILGELMLWGGSE